MCHKKRKLTNSRSQIWYWHPAKFWIKDFILPHRYHAPSFYRRFCHTLVNWKCKTSDNIVGCYLVNGYVICIDVYVYRSSDLNITPQNITLQFYVYYHKNYYATWTGLKITVGHRTMSDQNQSLSDQTKNTPDILPNGKNIEAKLHVRPDYVSSQP